MVTQTSGPPSRTALTWGERRMHSEFGQTSVSEVTAVIALDRLDCPDPSSLFQSIETDSCPVYVSIVPGGPISQVAQDP